MNTMVLTCSSCGNLHEKPIKEWNRRLRLGKTKSYCSQSCANVASNTIHCSMERECIWCKKIFRSTTHKNHKKCCSDLCAHRVSHSYVNPVDISETLKRRYKKQEKTCPQCSAKFVGRAKFCSYYCVRNSRRAHLEEFERYKRECRFNFNIKDYPNEFDFNLLATHGMYKPKNHGNNLGGVSRDHIMSVRWGFDNNVSSKMISHPANCCLMLQSENSRKHCKKTISVQELNNRILTWNSKYSHCTSN